MRLKPREELQGRYCIVSLLGEGGMAAVYRAHDLRLNTMVALKEMVPQAGLGSVTLEQLREQFRQEAMALAQLDHPHLVDVTDFFEERGNVYLVMKYIEGESLAQHIARAGALPEQQVVAWGRQLLDALAYCHSRHILHRDIKPANIIIRPDPPGARRGSDGHGQAVLVDFGLVKLVDPDDPHTRTVIRSMGTPHYIPPEQYDGISGNTDERSDIFALGATLYHALTGQQPPTATQRMAAPEKLVPPRRLNHLVSERTDAVILKALELQSAQRWQSAAEMMRALAGTGVPALAPVSEAAPVLERPEARPAEAPAGRRFKVGWVLGGLLLLVLISAAVTLPSVLGWVGATPTSTPSPTALPPSQTPAPRPTATEPKMVATPTLTATPSRTPTHTPTATKTQRPTATATATSISTPTPIATRTPLPSPTWTATRVPPTWTPSPLPPTETPAPPTSQPQESTPTREPQVNPSPTR